jgi:CubicO group peptidase (beta-lactamase class C family)
MQAELGRLSIIGGSVIIGVKGEAMEIGHEGRLERLGEFAAEMVEAKGVPGVAVGVLYEGRAGTAGFGITSVEHPLEVTGKTLFQIGSITKIFTGTAVMRLVERGDLDLDAPVRSYLPAFKVVDEAASAKATLRHLLSHTGGWAGDFFRDTGSGDDALARYATAMAELDQLAPIGTHFSYNNAGFSLAGHLIEVVTGERYETAMRELVLEPLGLESCAFEAGEVLTHRFVVGHSVAEGEARVARPWSLLRSAHPAGAVVCHVEDLLRFARFHLGDGLGADGSRVLSTGSLALMQMPEVTVWGEEKWGLPWAIDETWGTRLVSHGGGTTGQVSLLTLAPEHDIAVAVLTNADQGAVIARDVTRWALKEYVGVEITEPEPLEVPVEELAAYAGYYRGWFSDAELGVLAGRLVGQIFDKRGFPSDDAAPSPPPPPMSFAVCGDDRLMIMDGPGKDGKVDVVRHPDGSVGWLRLGRRLLVRDGGGR